MVIMVVIVDERGGIHGDHGIRRFSSQDTSHSSFQNCGDIFDDYGRGVYSYHTRHSSSHNPGDHGIFLCLYVSSHNVQKLFTAMK